MEFVHMKVGRCQIRAKYSLPTSSTSTVRGDISSSSWLGDLDPDFDRYREAPFRLHGENGRTKENYNSAFYFNRVEQRRNAKLSAFIAILLLVCKFR